MIKVTEINPGILNNQVVVSLFSDTKEEVATTSTEDIVGFPVGKDIETGSAVITANADIAFMKSDGTWNWIE